MTIKNEHHFGALFVLQILSSLFAKNSGLFLFAKKISANFFVSNEGNQKSPIMGVLEDWDFLKKKFFVYASYASCMYSEENKKVAIMGIKRAASLYGENFFSVWENM